MITTSLPISRHLAGLNGRSFLTPFFFGGGVGGNILNIT